MGGSGIDTVSYANATAGTNGQGVTVNLGLTSAQNTIRAGTDTLSGFENLTGSQFNDTLTGTSGNNNRLFSGDDWCDHVLYGYDPNTIAAERVASGLDQPIFAGAPPGDSNRLLIVEKRV